MMPLTSPVVIDKVPSRCAECGEPVTSEIVDRAGKVYQRHYCPAHSVNESLIFSDSDLYRKLDFWNGLVFPEDRPASAHRAGGCACGPTGGANGPTLAVIDITNRCNFACPMCFASISGDGDHYFLDPELVRTMLQSLLDRPQPCRHVQFSGGEPTLHPQFTRILRMAREMGFTHIQVATNGSRFAGREYTAECAESGLDTLYLQFDGMSDEVYRTLRGRPLLEAKVAAVENIARTGMRLVLVPTIVEGVNVDQLGPIFRFALEHSRHITGISVQPAARVGRAEVDGHDAEPFNLATMAREFGLQTGLTRFPEDWFPLSAVSLIGRAVNGIRGEQSLTPACDAHCSLGTYFYIDDDNRPHCVPHFFEVERFFGALARIGGGPRGGLLARRISEMREFGRLAECFDKRTAPSGLTFQRLLRGLEGWEDKSVGRSAGWFRRGFNGMFVAGMHFMDARSYNLRRLRRCIIQYVTTSGETIPFCSYNSGARLRRSEESARLGMAAGFGEAAAGNGAA
jgi:7,8-dihydro-6-hydroxymethylpterin dimethyltransferase